MVAGGPLFSLAAGGIGLVAASAASTTAAATTPSSVARRLQLDYEERGDHELYADLKESSDELKTQLADMLYRQREAGVWSRDVFEYLLL